MENCWKPNSLITAMISPHRFRFCCRGMLASGKEGSRRPDRNRSAKATAGRQAKRRQPPHRHPGERRDPLRHHHGAASWIPAFAEMTLGEPAALTPLFGADYD